MDLVFTPGWISHVELNWEFPSYGRFLRRLASFSRLIIFDKRGTGLSDAVPVTQLPNLEQRMDDVRAVMDAVGSTRAALLGVSEGGAMNLLFAAAHPERTQALILLSTYARMAWAADYPFGVTREAFDKLIEQLEQGWGRGVLLGSLAPSLAPDERVRNFWAQYQRSAASPGAAVALMQMTRETDARSILPVIRAPTLVIHRTDDRFIPVEHGRYLAKQIQGAKYVELPGNDHLPHLGDCDAVLDEIQQFLTGTRGSPEAERVLATILFVDIVESTEHLAQMGDRRWRTTLDSYYAVVRKLLNRFRGREVDTAGDGFFALFDGPARAVQCASAIGSAVRTLGVDVRAGVHTGECQISGDQVTGLAVHVGVRIAALANPRELLVSSTVKDLTAGSGLSFRACGVHDLKGVPGKWSLFKLENPETVFSLTNWEFGP